MTQDDEQLIRVAILTERRLATMEQQLSTLIMTVTRLDEKVGIQNGRVGKAEVALLKLEQEAEDHEEYIEKPRWATMDSMGSQLRQLWEERVERVNNDKQLDAENQKKQKWWSGFKIRLETVLAVLGIAGGIYTLISRLLIF